uniref:Merozoite surface antigen-1 n=1 Tax=Babesia bovis TaxID=5865 RepID=F8WQW4_BABBO|nr:merozoite surface antigen-1 [Babesia bovis]BAK57352.1 merozoite surface antigen-1 [Babesia bovis]
MATFVLFISALCCVLAITSAGEELTQSDVRNADTSIVLPEGSFYDDMSKFYGAVGSFDQTKLYSVLSANFKAAKMDDQKVKDTSKNLYKVNALIKNNPMIRPDLFNATIVSGFSTKNDEEKFNAIFDSIKGMYYRAQHMDKYLESLRWNTDIVEEDREKAVEYFKKHVYTGEHVVDVNGMAGVCKEFLSPASDFYKLVESFDAFAHAKVHAQVGNFVKPGTDIAPPKDVTDALEKELQEQKPARSESTEVPAPGDASGVQQPPASGTSPQGPAPTTPSPSPESSGNLQGQQGTTKPAGSSFTYGGLTVATLCYFVLSAF